MITRSQFAARERAIDADLSRLAEAREWAAQAAAAFGFDEEQRYQVSSPSARR
jgi:hypothetical protein